MQFKLLERLAYCSQNEPSYSTLGRARLHNSLSLHNRPLFTTEPCLYQQERRALWRSGAGNQLGGGPEAALQCWWPQNHLGNLLDTDASPPPPDTLIAKYFRQGPWAQLCKETVEKGRHGDVTRLPSDVGKQTSPPHKVRPAFSSIPVKNTRALAMQRDHRRWYPIQPARSAPLTGTKRTTKKNDLNHITRSW